MDNNQKWSDKHPLLTITMIVIIGFAMAIVTSPKLTQAVGETIVGHH